MPEQPDSSASALGDIQTTAILRKHRISRQLPELRQLVDRLRWIVPITLALTVIVYNLTLAPWMIIHYGYRLHLLMELLLFASLGPLIALVVLDLFGRWLDERDTADYQAQLLAAARQERAAARQLTDDTFQTLYATSMLLQALGDGQAQLPPKAAEQLEAAQRALNEGMSRLHAHLSE